MWIEVAKFVVFADLTVFAGVLAALVVAVAIVNR